MAFLRLFWIWIFLLYTDQAIHAQKEIVSDSTIAATVLMDEVVVTPQNVKWTAKDFIEIMKKDTSLYEAFSQLRQMNYQGSYETKFYDKKGWAEASSIILTEQNCQKKCCSNKIIKDWNFGPIKDKDGNYEYLTLQLLHQLFLRETTYCQKAVKNNSDDEISDVDDINLNNASADETDEIPDNKTTMERMVRKQHIIPDGKLSDDTRKNFERNLQNVVKTAAKHEINLYLSTVISNTFTQEPLGDSDLALLQYKKGKSLLNEQKTDSAVTLLVNAKNNDPLPFRAPSFINNTIRQVADDYAVPLLDLNKSTYSNPDFITNAESWFTDHLHFSTKTNKYVAREIAQYFSDNDSSLYYTSTQLTHLNPDPFDSVLAEVSNQILTSSYPFSESGIAQKIRLKLIKNLRSGSTTDRSVAKFIQGKTRPPQLYQDLTDQSLQSESELQLLRGLFYHTPFSEETINKSLTRLSENLTSPNSLYLASDIISINPVPQLFNLIGAHYLSTNQTALAINWLKAANKRFPDNKGILYNLARAFQIAGDTETSKLYYSQFKQL
jgi:hypothetical protein